MSMRMVKESEGERNTRRKTGRTPMYQYDFDDSQTLGLTAYTETGKVRHSK